MDQEIAVAASNGIKFWAFVWYKPDDSLHTAWELYQQSANKDKINWCGIVGPSELSSINVGGQNWQQRIRRWAGYMTAANYQRTSAHGITNRPLVFIYPSPQSQVSNRALVGHVTEGFNYLRKETTDRGAGPPYIVMLGGVAAAQFSSATGTDAISNYIFGFRAEREAPYRFLDVQTRQYWTALRATGRPVVPISMLGWDPRPRMAPPGPLHINQDPSRYYIPPTPTEFASQVRAAVHYIKENPAVCESRVLLIYSWDECDEGGGIIPTLGDPAGSYLSAIAPILK